ncbi:MAG: hypothetical protein IJ025_03050 [Clostridia bacterium]|nr:hypothetical protein [Clostridia bacterium]
MSENLSLKVITPEKESFYENCESVIFCVNDNKKGNGGGSYGIRKGHAKAIFSLAKGKLSVLKNGEAAIDAKVSSGFARIENNVVIVIVDEFEII